MTGPDDEFEEFLKRRKPVFRRPGDEMFEPPAELDRVVLRQAREAIKPEEPMRVFSAPRWSMPIALAATLLLAFTVIFRAGMPQPKPAPDPEVTVQDIADRVEAPVVAVSPPPAPAREAASSPVATATVPMVASETPAWRHDPKAWQAEIQRLRDAGDIARAEAESAEFKRQQRAFASSPDR
jgi:hypothetical protein